MEPITMAATAIGILGPYVAKGAEEFAKTAGKEAYEKTKKLFATLKTRWSGDEEATSTLTNFEKKPNRYEPVLKSILEEELAKDANFRTELARQLEEIGPYVEVIQKMKKGEDITGLQVDEMNKGKAIVNQEMDEAKNVIGAVVKRLG
jgi:hypothetical protein